jgi:hypothetical protein
MSKTFVPQRASTYAVALCASLLLSACGANTASDEARPATPSKDAAAAAPIADTSTSVKVAETADEIPLAKDESLHEPRYELPGVPTYPNARSIALKGIGPVMKLGNSSRAFYSVTASALDIWTFYREKLAADGWNSAFDGLETEPTHTTQLLKMVFQKDKQVVSFDYHDGTTGREITGPRLAVTYSEK